MHTHTQVQYYGLIKQATGEDWDDTRISLSTAQPSIGGSAPPLPTRIIRFKRPPPRPYYAQKAMLLGSSGQERFRAISSRTNDMRLRSLECAGLDSEASSEGWEDDEEVKGMDGLALGFGGGVPPPPPLPGAASVAARGAPPPALAVATAKVSISRIPIPLLRTGNETACWPLA